MLRVALIALAHGVTSTTVDLSQDWAVAIDANAKSTLDVVVEDVLVHETCRASGSGARTQRARGAILCGTRQWQHRHRRGRADRPAVLW